MKELIRNKIDAGTMSKTDVIAIALLPVFFIGWALLMPWGLPF